MFALFQVFGPGESTHAKPITDESESEEIKEEKMNRFIQWKKERAEVEHYENMKPRSEKDILNFLLVGVDNPDSRRNGRSDTMMILTMDKKNKKIKLTSLMRDTYVFIAGHGNEKLNHSYAYGGIKLLKETVENSFKIKIDNYVIVDFHDFQAIIDIIGGVEVYVDEKEKEIINKYIEDREEKIEKEGTCNLMGEEALTYARIREIGGCEARTERQREVMKSAQWRLKKLSVFKYPKLIGAVMKSIDTDMNFLEILDYGYWFSKNIDKEMDTLQIPSSEFSKGELIENKGWVLVMDKVKNLKLLGEFIYGR